MLIAYIVLKRNYGGKMHIVAFLNKQHAQGSSNGMFGFAGTLERRFFLPGF